MKIVQIVTEKAVKKSKKELEIEREQKENFDPFLIDTYKRVPLKEPVYVVEMSAKEIQLVSFYLELENRKPIMNIELDTKITQEKNND